MNEQGHIFDSKNICWQAIENADGVPYKLIFGSKVGEGYYSNIGSGIRQLLGMVSDADFTEKIFLEKVEKIVPLSTNVPDDIPMSREKFILGELKNYNAEVLINLDGGKKKWIRDTSIPLVDERTGEVIGALGILFDINEQKMTQETLTRVKTSDIQSDFLKSAFLRNISHEIRTPLNAIVGFSTLINEPDTTQYERQEIMNILQKNADHLLEIMTNIVEISNIEAGTVVVRKGVINIDATLKRIFDRYWLKALEKGISLRYSESQDVKEISLITDGFKLFQILIYLLDNALKFTETGKIEFGYSLSNGNIEFYVSDSGIGIPVQDHPKIFTRFYQVESGAARRFDGTGLGLVISKAYVDLLGGKIWFTSKPGEGSVFYFALPYEQTEA